MRQSTFEKNHEEEWQTFDQQLAVFQQLTRIEQSIRRRTIDRQETDSFLASFERISDHLAVAKTRGYSVALIDRLNDLVSRGHLVLPIKERSFFRKVVKYFNVDFPTEVRRARMYVLVATIAFLGPALITGALIQYRPHYVTSVISPSTLQQMERMYTEYQTRLGRERSNVSDVTMFGFYVYNNTSIGLRVFATGVLFCVPALVVLAFNGTHISAIVNHLIVIGLGSNILGFIAGHSAFELTAIVLSGAAGLILGYALIHPGSLTRSEAVRIAGLRATQIILGAAFLFILAAFIEAFWSSIAAIPAIVKYFVGGALWLLTLSYFLFAGRNADRATADSS